VNHEGSNRIEELTNDLFCQMRSKDMSGKASGNVFLSDKNKY
jgi:hypothetical protein